MIDSPLDLIGDVVQLRHCGILQGSQGITQGIEAPYYLVGQAVD
jgi:hypothetical protein